MEARRPPGAAGGAPLSWIPLADHPVGAVIATFASRSFVSRDPAGEGLRVRYEVAPLDDAAHATATDAVALRADAWFGPHTEGPPGHAHGGSMAAVLDEAMGLAVWLAHRPAVAAHLETDFRQPIPLGTTARVTTRVGPVEGSGRASATARLEGADGTVFAEGRAVFVLLGERHAGRFQGGGA